MKDIASRLARFDAIAADLPLVAILRGLTPVEAVPIARRLHASGFRLIEVPLNSPDPFDSIAAIRADLGDDTLVGAGTVTSPAAVDRLAAIGADLVVMPHADTAVIAATVAAGLVSIPGIATPTEAFAALAAGAHALKLFPAELLSPTVLKALRSVLPKGTRLMPVGGIVPESLAPYRAAGAAGFGLGGALYRPGDGADEVGRKADRFVAAWRGRAD
jgi:2-dehydro-3-deoxyphosphogalactonate aldolase